MKILVATILLLPALALSAPATAPASGAPSHGLSGNVVGSAPPANGDQTASETRDLLNQQAHSQQPDRSELSAPIYVQTQQRLGKSFDKPIPDFSKDQTKGSGQ